MLPIGLAETSNFDLFGQSNLPTDAALIAIGVDRAASAPLFQQVYEALRHRIAAGAIPAGRRLPASRPFAAELGVSRATVVLAYDQLVAEGYAESHPRSGLRACPVRGLVPDLPACPPPPVVAQMPTGPARPFQPGLPDLRLFPHRDWARCLARVARSEPEALTHPGDPFGDPRLRAAIALHLADWRGIAADPRQILITAGAGDALDLILRSLAAPGDTVALETPGYRPLRRSVLGLGLRPLWLPVDPHGAALPQPDVAPPRVTILTPSHQFPLGGALSTGRRRAFLDRAAATDGVLVEDDYDSEFRYAGRPIPALASLDTAGRVIYVGSFSKVFSVGLRLGFAVVPDRMVGAVARTVQAAGTRASSVPQRPLARFIEDGGFHRHIRRMRRIYGQRRRLFLDLLRRRLGDRVAVTDHQAGMHLAVRLPAGTDDRAVCAALADAGASAVPLSGHYAEPPGRPGLLLGFCAFSEVEIVAGIDALDAGLRHV